MSQQINLYEARLRPNRALLSGRNVCVAAACLVGLMVAWGAWVRIEAQGKTAAALQSQQAVSQTQEKLVALTREVGERKVSSSLASEIDSVRALLAVREEVMTVLGAGALGNTTGFSGFMAGFARQAQNDLWLTGFRISEGGAEIEIRGRMLDPARLPAYVQRLGEEKVFAGRRFAALEMRGVEPEKAADAAAAGGKVPPASTEPAVRYVEFRLRSENALRGEKESQATTEGAP